MLRRLHLMEEAEQLKAFEKEHAKLKKQGKPIPKLELKFRIWISYMIHTGQDGEYVGSGDIAPRESGGKPASIALYITPSTPTSSDEQ